MACPYFYPEGRIDVSPKPARAPLGDVFHGRCELGGSSKWEHCNFGYASGCCDTFPKDASIDAVRFSCVNGDTIYILEKNHMPVGHGNALTLNGAKARQAQVFREWLAK